MSPNFRFRCRKKNYFPALERSTRILREKKNFERRCWMWRWNVIFIGALSILALYNRILIWLFNLTISILDIIRASHRNIKTKLCVVKAFKVNWFLCHLINKIVKVDLMWISHMLREWRRRRSSALGIAVVV